MSLASGTRLGPYAIVSPLGAGGMGEVYRATDTRLDRTVALKVLPAEVAADPQFRARFDREARAISQLQHPHICTLFDVGDDNGIAYLVMELLDGQTLSARIRKGVLPLDEALRIAVDVADALAAAHKRGIVHRDLKPGNIMLTKAGAKLLDFGLAKGSGGAGGAGKPGGSGRADGLRPGSPDPHDEATTMTSPERLTGVGTILGTLHYMAPEQVEGREVDTRTDIWAFGALLYEMLTGQLAFTGDSSAAIAGAILKDRPLPLSAKRPEVSPLLDHLVARCLEKDPDERWQSASDIARQLAWVMASPRATAAAAPSTAAEPPRGTAARRVAPWLVAVAGVAVAMIAVGWTMARTRAVEEGAPVVLSIAPPGPGFGPRLGPAISPDGTKVAFWAPDAEGVSHLYVRDLGEATARSLPSTEGPEETTGARAPAWSPDSRSLVYFSRGKLRRIDISGGVPVALADAGGSPRGLSWGSKGDLIAVPISGGGIYRLPAAGGPATLVDLGKLTSSAEWPSFLPDGVHFLFTHAVEQGDAKDIGVYVASLDDGSTTLVAPAWSRAEYARGFLYFTGEGILYRQRFDPATRATSGDLIRVTDDVGSMGGNASAAAFSVSTDGTVVSANSPLLPVSRLRILDRGGATVRTLGEVAQLYGIVMARDWSQLAVEHTPDRRNPNNNLWSVDLSSGASALAIRDAAVSVLSWTGDRLLFRTRDNGLGETKGLDENSVRKVSTEGLPGRPWPEDWSPDGGTVLVRIDSASTQSDIWALTVDGSKPPAPFLRSADSEYQARFSPNGRWVAYASDESGQDEVYVQSYPARSLKTRISTAGGTHPVWRRDGRELYFIARDGSFMAVAVDQNGPGFRAAPPQSLFKTGPLGSAGSYREQIAVSPDGRQFLMNLAEPSRLPTSIKVVLHRQGRVPSP